MATIIVNSKGGLAASVSGSNYVWSSNGNNGNLTPTLLSPYTIEQIVGLVPLFPLPSTDDRYNILQTNGFYLPVFSGGDTSPTYKTDCNNFLVNITSIYVVPTYPIWVVQQLQDDFFKPTSTKPGQWITVGNVTDNTYGLYWAPGTIPNYPNRTQFKVNWSSVYNAFGNGIYRIALANPVQNAGTQASATSVITSWSGSQSMKGTLNIKTSAGVYSITIYFYGTYQGFLNYLAALINAKKYTIAPASGTPPNLTATVNSNGLTITGNNYTTSDGIQVSITLNDTGNYFQANTGGDSIVATQNTTGTNVVFTVNNKVGSNYLGLSTLVAGNYNTTTCSFTAVKAQGLTFYANVNALVTPNGATLGVNCVFTFKLIQNGTVVQTLSVTDPWFTYGTAPNNTGLAAAGVGFGKINAAEGDVFQLEVSASTTYTGNPTFGGGSAVMFICNSEAAIGGDPSYWENDATTGQVTTSLGTLAGGAAPTTTYVPFYITPPFQLWQWDVNKARGTIKFETNFSGTIGDRNNPGNLFDNSGAGTYDSIRLPGFFGQWTGKYDKVRQEYGFNPSTTMGTITTVRAKQVGTYKLNTLPVPYEFIRRLSLYAFLPPGLLISDYNFNNADWFLKQYPVISTGACEPKYLNKGNFDAEQNWKNRLCYLENMEFEEGIQSLIYSYTDLIS